MDPVARTRYAQCGDVDIAYQVFGAGPRDLLVLSGGSIPIDCVDAEPRMARFHHRLASMARVIRLDLRGIGLSGRVPEASLSFDAWVDDVRAVLDAVGSETAVMFAPSSSAPVAVKLAAEDPERVSGLIIINGSARSMWAEDYPAGVRQEFVDRFIEVGVLDDALERGFDGLRLMAPSVASDPVFRAWFDHSGNRGATPSMARRISALIAQGDVRHLLPAVTAPALVVHRNDNPFVGVGHGRYLAEHLPHARYVELPGADTLYWVGDTAPLLGEIEEFLTGVRGGSGGERVLATVLFTDIVGSTDRAARLGDDRWRDLLDHHDQMVRQQLLRFGGHEVNTAGDGFVATFVSPSRALECAEAIVDAIKPLGIEIRAGVHAGEVEMRGDDVAGMGVHIGARVAGLAEASEVLVSSTVREIVTGSGRSFRDRGAHQLKGVPGQWQVFALAPAGAIEAAPAGATRPTSS